MKCKKPRRMHMEKKRLKEVIKKIKEETLAREYRFYGEPLKVKCVKHKKRKLKVMESRGKLTLFLHILLLKAAICRHTTFFVGKIEKIVKKEAAKQERIAFFVGDRWIEEDFLTSAGEYFLLKLREEMGFPVRKVIHPPWNKEAVGKGLEAFLAKLSIEEEKPVQVASLIEEIGNALPLVVYPLIEVPDAEDFPPIESLERWKDSFVLPQVGSLAALWQDVVREDLFSVIERAGRFLYEWLPSHKHEKEKIEALEWIVHNLYITIVRYSFNASIRDFSNAVREMTEEGITSFIVICEEAYKGVVESGLRRFEILS